MGFFSWSKPSPVVEKPKGDHACAHKWRVFASTQVHHMTCEHCRKEVSQQSMLDALFVDLQNRSGVK